MTLKSRILGIGLVFFLCIALFLVVVGGSLNKASANDWLCQYGGGITESHGLKKTVAPGTSGGFSLFDTQHSVPSDDRFYFNDKDPNTADYGGNPIEAPAKGTTADSQGIVQVQAELQARFVIPETACELYTDKLRRLEPLNFNAAEASGAPAAERGSPGGWAKFLNVQLNQSLIKAIRPLISPYDYVQLYSNSMITVDGKKVLVYDYIESELSTAITEQLKQSLGGTYFCGPSYSFDQKVDGVFENGCPPIEIVVKKIEPVDGQFITNLQTTVANQEQTKVIKSEQDKRLAETEANKATTLAQTEADKLTELAAIDADKAVQTAEVAKDQAIALAKKELFEADTANAVVKAQAETAFCSALTALGVDCAEYFRAMNWNPSIILGDGSADVLVNATP